MSTISNLEMWSIIVGALTPPVLALVQQPRWPGWFRSALMVATAVLVGVVTAWLQGTLTFARFTDSALIAGVAIIAAYHGIWKPSGVASTIEKASSGVPTG